MVIEKELKWIKPRYFRQVLEIDGETYVKEKHPVDLAAAKYFEWELEGGAVIRATPRRDPMAQELPAHILDTCRDYFAEGGPVSCMVKYGTRICNLKRVYQEMKIAAGSPEAAHKIAKLKSWLIKNAWEKHTVALHDAKGNFMETLVQFHASGKIGLDGGRLRNVKQTTKGFYIPIDGVRWYFPVEEGIYLPYMSARFPGDVTLHKLQDYHR
jgi:hypothetical protein